MKKTVTFVFLLSSLLLTFTPRAQTDNTACTGAIFLVPDGSPHEGTFTVLGQSRHFRFVARANRSYAVMVENLSPTDGEQNVSMTNPTDACAGTNLPITSNSQTEPFNNIGLGMSQFGGARLSLVAANNTEAFFAVGTGLASVPGNFRVRVEETTLFNPGWSRGGGFNTFYSFQNTTNATCNATLTLFNAGGTQVATSNLMIAAGALAAVNTTGLMFSTSDTFGTATLTHNCPPGGILADAAIANFGTSPAAIIPAKFQSARQQR